LQNSAFTGVLFPYVALCPSTRKKSLFTGITDVYDEIIRLSDEAEQKGFNVGEAIYTQSFFFTDHALLVDNTIQNRIREYQFCKQFSCLPYPSLQETPHKIIEQFSVIEEEFNFCVAKKQQEKKDA
tara:strand:- start:434 stop:811 length:378 start_codon:yes stop_codon:yes gene_type:complete